MALRISFFATKDDLVPVLHAVERKREIKYVSRGIGHALVGEEFASSERLPSLGVAPSEAAVNGDRYLLCRKGAVLQARRAGGNVHIDQMLNPDTVSFLTGGLWSGDVLLYGEFSTIGRESFAVDLMKVVRAEVRTRFERIRAYWVGEGAARLLDAGKRLAMAAQSPREYDLRR